MLTVNLFEVKKCHSSVSTGEARGLVMLQFSIVYYNEFACFFPVRPTSSKDKQTQIKY